MEEIGRDWLAEQVDEMPDSIARITPVKFNEENRYLPQGVSPRPGYIRYDLFPFLKEIIECFDPLSPVREVNLKKGVQVGYTTALESIMLYYIAHIKTQPLMFLTADDGLASIRVENNIIPMINESGFSDLIRSNDEGNSRKTGKTKDLIQWEGGGSMIYNGANSASKMRMNSVPLMLKDELDGWKRSVGKDGNSDSLTDARLSAYWSVRKIFRGSTPLLEPSMISEAYDRGDQRKYMVLCKACSFPQFMKFENIDKESGEVSGFQWEMEDGVLVLESVRYCCKNCGHGHYEHDKEKLFATESGAHWLATAKPREPGIRSYHLPAFYSPFGFRPWYKGVSDYLESFDPKSKQVKSISKYQEFYNNTLGEPFKTQGSKLRFESVSAHRRACYKLGQVPNVYAAEHSGSPVLLLCCQVDVHKSNLAVTVFGVCKDLRTYVVDYWRFEDDDCTELSSPVWGRLRELIEEKRYTADDGKVYGMTISLIDAGYANDTVTTFCADYSSGVYPILGRDRPGKNQTIKEFSEFTTQAGTVGYKITVDHYKDRLAPVLRREWLEETGPQNAYHFNAPIDIPDKHLKELTVEIRQKKTDANGHESYVWHRPGNARNELWDLLGYCHAGVEILAWAVCIQHFKLETIDWPKFWEYIEVDQLYFEQPSGTL
mgnify:CR=1 FL=1